MVDVSAARGSFTLRRGDAPVVLLSAGIGVTPVLSMLHALAADASLREVWWLYGVRDSQEHPFAEETRSLLKALMHSHSPMIGPARTLILGGAWICACSRTCKCHVTPTSIYADRSRL
jgi:hypothetical protein